MKYFTPQMWLGFNNPNSGRREVAFKTYDRRLTSYKKQLAKLLPQLNTQARRFFREVCLLHDGTLTRFEIGDRIDHCSGPILHNWMNRRDTMVRLFVLSENGDFVYELNYREVTLVRLNFPGEVTLFPVGLNANFGDWGYDELTATKKSHFRHEILFASGSTITVEFRKFTFSKRIAHTEP